MENELYETYGDALPADAIVMLVENLNGKTIAFRQTPKGTAGSDSLVRAVVATAGALGALDAAVGAANPPDAPPLGVMELRARVAPAFTSLQIKMASTAASIDRARVALETAQRKFYEPAAVTGDALLADIERRAVFAAIEAPEKDALWQAMADGEQPALLAALGRFDFGATADRARVVYRALAAQRDPSAVQRFSVEDERLTWAETTLDQITATVDAAAMQLGPADAVAEPEPAQRRAA